MKLLITRAQDRQWGITCCIPILNVEALLFKQASDMEFKLLSNNSWTPYADLVSGVFTNYVYQQVCWFSLMMGLYRKNKHNAKEWLPVSQHPANVLGLQRVSAYTTSLEDF